jgi:signal transduction histidine kinase
MEQLENIAGMLDLMVRPAFCVKDGVIAGVNQGARSCLIDTDTPIRDLLHTGLEEYSEFSDGCLYLTLNIQGRPMGASVTKQAGFDIFILEQDADRAELSAMALAAQELREPLSSVLTVADRLFPMVCEDAASQDQISRINRGLYQILRTISNMSDAARYQAETEGILEIRNITAVMEEIFQNSAALIGQAGITVRFYNLSQPLYMLLDQEKLERAIHNILSNAMKFTPKDGFIDARVTIRDTKLYLTVQDSGTGVDPALRSCIHSRYLRQPGLEDGRFGIGLGMVLIRAAASVHGGVVLMEHPDQGGTRITVTMNIRQDTGEAIRSPIMKVDYSGERNHALIELSDGLPAELYKKETIN